MCSGQYIPGVILLWQAGQNGNTRQHCFSDNHRKTSGMRKYEANNSKNCNTHKFSSTRSLQDSQEATIYVTQVCSDQIWCMCEWKSAGCIRKYTLCSVHTHSVYFALWCTLAAHVKPFVSLLDTFAFGNKMDLQCGSLWILQCSILVQYCIVLYCIVMFM